MLITNQIQTLDEAKRSMLTGVKVLTNITSLLTLLIVLAFIKLSRLDISYLIPIILAGMLILVRYRMSKFAAISLPLFPLLMLANILKDFDLDGEFWLTAVPFILHMLFISFFFYGCYRIIEGVFAYHRLQETGKVQKESAAIADSEHSTNNFI